MKHWEINKEDSKKKYLTLNKEGFCLTEIDDKFNIEEALEDKKVLSHKIIALSDLKEILVIDTDHSIELRYESDKKTDEDLELQPHIYKEVKTFLIDNINGVEIKEYSLLKQLTPKLIGLGVSGLLTWILFTTASAIENGETISTSGGRRRFFKRVIVWIAETLGVTGTLVIGGLITAFFAYLVITNITKPKEGQVIKIKAASKLNFD
ncbi:hypothetical protein [uncultured Lacinutrix sp.]|uniref:hypothetical protein n=1 Tax=uncultured Lacinutrix sp. TaxID=574032 RepID=UPI00261B1A96|nr:hypothetical protein [uncultured Lacinutrix sp.]